MTRPEIEIFESTGLLVLSLLGALCFSAYSICALGGIVPQPDRGEWAMYAGAALFPLISVALVIRVAQSRIPVVILSEAGIRYRFFSLEIIPWGAVLSVEEARGSDEPSGVRLKLDPEFARQVPRRGAGRIFPKGSSGYVVDVSASGTGREELYQLIYAWWDSRRSKRDSQ